MISLEFRKSVVKAKSLLAPFLVQNPCGVSYMYVELYPDDRTRARIKPKISMYHYRDFFYSLPFLGLLSNKRKGKQAIDEGWALCLKGTFLYIPMCPIPLILPYFFAAKPKALSAYFVVDQGIPTQVSIGSGAEHVIKLCQRKVFSV